MKKHKNAFLPFLCVMMLIVESIFSQTPDVFRMEYMLMPENSGEVETSRIKLVLNVPIAVRDKKDYVVVGAEYNRYNFEVPDDLFPDSGDLSKFHVLDVNFAYLYKLSEKWNLIGVVTPRWSSNFVEELQDDDFNMNYTVGAYKNVVCFVLKSLEILALVSRRRYYLTASNDFRRHYLTHIVSYI